MADVRASWDEVGDRLQELGLKLQLHLEQAATDGRTEDEDRIREALHGVADAVEQAFTALGNAAGDDAVRDDLRDVGGSVVEALDATFSELGERVRELLGKR
jgi:hypothetical protein